MSKNGSNKQKILYVITQGAWGGAQRYIFDLATSLKDTYDITVAVGEPQGPQDLQKALTNEGILVIQLRHLKRAISPPHDTLAIAELKDLYTQISPDIIHLNSSKAGVIGSIPETTAKRIYTAHGWVFQEPHGFLRKKFYTLLEKHTAHRKDAIIVLSESEKQAAKSIGIMEEKLHIIPNGIAKPTFLTKQEARAALVPNAPDTPWIGLIAGLYPSKGISVLLKAIAREASLKGSTCVIIGDGPQRTILETQKKQLQLGNVHFVGYKEHAAQYMKAFDVLTLPSYKEGLPYTALESIAAGTPFIGTQVGALPELAQNAQEICLVQPGDSEALAKAILEILARQRQSLLPDMYALSHMIEATTHVYKNGI